MALRKIRLNEFKKYVDLNVENGSDEVKTVAHQVKPSTPTALLTSEYFDCQSIESTENGEESRVEFRIKSSESKSINIQQRDKLEEEELHEDDLLALKFEEFGATPPRTRIKNARDWDRKKKAQAIQAAAASCDVTPIPPKRNERRRACGRVLRRNTMDCALLNEMFVNEETKRSAKRTQALLRDEERTFKNTQNTIIGTFNTFSKPRLISYNENFNNVSVEQNLRDLSNEVALRTAPKVIESANRYMSVSSRPSGYRSSAPPLSFMSQKRHDAKVAPGLNKRKEFHETFANLIKLGSVDRQECKLSHEEQTWQTELKDLIWLELQAWQADRTMEQQDRYLFTARQNVSDLLTQIISYKFQPRSCLILNDTDSGMSSDSTTNSPQPLNSCSGCMSLYCKYCQLQQNMALKEVEELLTRLEAAEVLYPSSQVMGAFHPIYKSQSFVGRIKAMCLWYNITKQNQLKLSIFGKILARLQGSRFSWPVQTSITGTSDSGASTSSYDDSAINSMDSTQTPTQQRQRKKSTPNVTKVHFQLNDIAHVPEESSSSNESPTSEIAAVPLCAPCPPCLRKNSIHAINIFSVEPLDNANGDTHSTLLYRKFIENVLKSRGLPKAMSFLNKLHNVVLFKAHISLEKPGTLDYDYETDMIEEDVPCIDPDISREQIDELRRYGYWSEEARSINLPSYIPTFVFLSGIPLQFMHEFLRMRLETRPMKPNPLSLEQLMKELREGLTLALTHRERYQRHITTALSDQETEWERYKSVLDQYDKTVKKVFELYLDYIDQMVLVAAAENHWKPVLEKEWMFTKLVSPMINGMHTIAANKFCNIISNMLRSISSRLVNRVAELDEQIYNTAQSNESDIKWQVLTICRETQTLFTLQRERAVKVMLFAKNFCRDVESRDFHREHYEESETVQEFICSGVVEAFGKIQQDVLDLREELTKIIRNVQERCFKANMSDMDDQDRQAVLSRTREILHQGYKFGFEYHKDVIRLFEQPVMAYKESNNVHLALGIIEFAKMWMQFVRERCERGRGMRPRWASQGLEFLILACDPQITQHLDEIQFDELKKKMDSCISHVIGITSEPEKIARKKASPRTRKTSSPAASRSRTPTRNPAGLSMNNTTPLSSPQLKVLHTQTSLKEESLPLSDKLTIETEFSKPDANSSTDMPDFVANAPTTEGHGNGLRLIVPKTVYGGKSTPNSASSSTDNFLVLRQVRVRDAVNRLDMEIEEKLRERNLIGQIKALNSCDKIQIRARSVNFRWHRGIKIGQGRFGKVYTAVNNNTGELMAMKEIAIQPGETRALKNVAEELKILEGVNHKNLVRYYGIEVHREELLIFMELCSEGTLESLVELSGGLPEGLTRRFSAQLLSGVAELHKHGIVHRDIKTANIFLVDGSNSLKLGDFGSAVKIQAHTTVPGELQGYVGTQAYMAPEVFTKNNSDGHGRAADIWSVGCVVVEMASGSRPWAQFDSNFQIMFKVGMGEKPEVPSNLSQEGHDFLEHCLQHDPKLRMTAVELLEQNFCKYGRDEELSIEQLQEGVRRSFRRNAKIT